MKSICVFCGAHNGASPAFNAAACAIGKGIAIRGWRLVNGAGTTGLMGSTATGAKKAGGKVLGVIPEHLMLRERTDQDSSACIVTDDMHARKKLMFTNSDAAVILPGGAGTLDEFFEILAWAQLGLHTRPIILCNVESFWDPLIALINHIIAHNFAQTSLRTHFSVENTPRDVLNRLDSELSE